MGYLHSNLDAIGGRIGLGSVGWIFTRNPQESYQTLVRRAQARKREQELEPTFVQQPVPQAPQPVQSSFDGGLTDILKNPIVLVGAGVLVFLALRK